MRSKKAQGWGIDLIVALMIFSAATILFYTFSLNYFSDSEDNFNLLKNDGELIMNHLLSEGYPQNWNQTNVVKIGLLSNERINQTKLELFYNLTQTDYQKTKNLFLTKYDYFFSIENKNITISVGQIRGIGKPRTIINKINATNLIKIKRISVYKEKPVTVYLYVWEE